MPSDIVFGVLLVNPVRITFRTLQNEIFKKPAGGGAAAALFATNVGTRQFIFSPSINSDNLSFERPFVVELSVYFQRLSLLD